MSGDEWEGEPIFMRPEYDVAVDACARLQAILDGPRFGEVEGVVFDLRHEKLPSAEEWHAPGGARPFGVAFPWDRTLFDGDAEAAASYVTSGASELGSGVTHVYPGDRVTVERLERFFRGVGRPPYVDPHDAYSLDAYLIVTRPDGTTEKIENPISFNARDAMGPASPHFYAGADGRNEWVGDFRVSLLKASYRLRRLLDETKSGPAVEWLNLAAEATIEVVGDHEALAKVLSRDGDDLFAPDLARLLDLAVTWGYALAKAEAAPLVKSAQNRTRPATRARMARADPVREAAKADILANPKTTQTACARRVALQLERDQRSVEKLIAPLFAWVTLPGGTKEKRPRSPRINPRQIDGWPGLSSV
ncbi:hypothetical protein [Brevundimonas naejangsanensis]|uniref:hypothetical protein n=1 Tax=Brevundimonas naejangsanensis TaxID=588932 RepID=UPI0026F11DDC|nr:hypothetical protein [Brevundimonas naejangsanensis]